MKFEFDPVKSARNARFRNLPFELAEKFDWANAMYTEDYRWEYPERRFVAVGYLEDRLHVICFTPTQAGLRIISLRRANDREVRNHEKETADR